jgi:hypothetical protein
VHASFVGGVGASDATEDRAARSGLRDARLVALRIAIAADRDPDHQIEHAATLELLDRLDRAGSADRDSHPLGWDLFAAAATALVGEHGWASRSG